MVREKSISKIWRRPPTLAIALVFLCSILVSATGFCYATEVWSDDFDDCNCDGWTVSGFSAEDGTLSSTSAAGTAYRESTVAEGTWSFDLELLDYSQIVHLGFEFGAITPTAFFMSTNPEETPWYFYAVYGTAASTQTGAKPVLQIRKNNPNGGGAFNTWVKLASYDLEEGDFGWKHIDVARTSSGQITVWLNGTVIMQVVDTEIDTSEYFVFMANENMGIDNIVLDDVPMASGIPLEILALSVGVPAIIIVSAVWVRRRGA